MTTPDCDYDVSIVGYGPVAATTALFLARRGFRVSLHERSTVPLDLPRAVGLDDETWFKHPGLVTFRGRSALIVLEGRRRAVVMFIPSPSSHDVSVSSSDGTPF